MQGLSATACDHSSGCLFVAAVACVCARAHVWLSLSGQVWRQTGRAGLVIEEAIEKGASH